MVENTGDFGKERPDPFGTDRNVNVEKLFDGEREALFCGLLETSCGDLVRYSSVPFVILGDVSFGIGLSMNILTWKHSRDGQSMAKPSERQLRPITLFPP